MRGYLRTWHLVLPPSSAAPSSLVLHLVPEALNTILRSPKPASYEALLSAH
jgi:hypothetical protein